MNHKPCSQWDDQARRCRSGHIVTTATCWHGEGPTPQCMMENPPPHLLQDSGYPLGWPKEKEQSHD